jgi:hypothetical protein
MDVPRAAGATMFTSEEEAMPFRSYRVLMGIAALAMGACGGGDEGAGPDGGDGPPANVTYYQHVKPILDAKCVQCHYEGGVAPFSLANYDKASVYAGVSKLAIEAGVMPPWHANDDCADYLGNRNLTGLHAATLLQWIDTGKAEGDPANPGPPIVTDATTLSRVDLTMSMAEGYDPQVDPDYYDDYRCFVLPWPEQATTYVSGFRAVPGNDAIVHHLIAFLASPDQVAQYEQLDEAEPGPGYRCFGGTGGPAQQWVGAWAPGGQGSDLPPGLGIEVQPGSAIILQVHYNTLYAAINGVVEPDQSSIEFKLDSQVDRRAFIMPWANPLWLSGDSMKIPANDPDASHSFAFDATYFPGMNATSFDIYSSSLHMHLLGSSGKLSIEHSDGSSECLLQIDNWDFSWQDNYMFRNSKLFERGDQLRLECHWDNSAANQAVVNGVPRTPQDVYWGESSTDEMCLGVLLVAPR